MLPLKDKHHILYFFIKEAIMSKLLIMIITIDF